MPAVVSGSSVAFSATRLIPTGEDQTDLSRPFLNGPRRLKSFLSHKAHQYGLIEGGRPLKRSRMHQSPEMGSADTSILVA